MRPVTTKYPTSQGFASLATAGVVANLRGTTVQQLVALYGNYQPFGHAGEDIACPVGTPVVAMADGTVLYAGWAEDLPGDDTWSTRGYFMRWALYRFFPGIVTVIQHDGWIGIYAHLSDNDAAPKGTRVKEGQLIGLSGNTSSRNGRLGAHLHVEAVVDTQYRTGGGLIYGRTNPARFYGSTAPGTGVILTQGATKPAAPAAPTPTPEEDEDMTPTITLMREPDGKIWATQDFITKWHVPDPTWITHYLNVEKWGWLKLRRDSKGNHLHNMPAFGAQVAAPAVAK